MQISPDRLKLAQIPSCGTGCAPRVAIITSLCVNATCGRLGRSRVTVRVWRICQICDLRSFDSLWLVRYSLDWCFFWRRLYNKVSLCVSWFIYFRNCLMFIDLLSLVMNVRLFHFGLESFFSFFCFAQHSPKALACRATPLMQLLWALHPIGWWYHGRLPPFPSVIVFAFPENMYQRS